MTIGVIVMGAEKNDDDWSPIPLKSMVQGALITESILLPVNFLLCWLCGKIFSLTRISSSTLFGIIVFSTILGAVCSGCISYICSQRQRSDHPAPWYVAIQALCLAIIAVVISVLSGSTYLQAVSVGLIMGIVELSVNLWVELDSHNKTLTREQVTEKIEQTQAMTQEVFADEIGHLHDAQQQKLDEVNRKHGVDKLH